MSVRRTQFRLAFIGVFAFIVYFVYTYYSLPNKRIQFTLEEIDFVLEKAYLVDTPKCKIQNVDPYNSEILKFIHRKDYLPCNGNVPLLSYVEVRNNVATLHINESVIFEYSYFKISCCYKIVMRKPSEDDPDGFIMFSDCIPFNKKVVPQGEIILVECRNVFHRIYSNTHAIIRRKRKVQKKIDHFKSDTRPLSVLFVGIDSISRINLIRMLPKTRNYLVENKWVEMRGYNKMGDNTFPNLMAVFTGKNESYAFKTCHPYTVGGLDDCDLIWYDFNKAGYVTAYAEDEVTLNTFNYLKKGFNVTPTDFYYRPYFMASETLPITMVDWLSYCTGPVSSGERVLNLAKDFSTTFKNHPFFGVFWTNTFSHNDISTPSCMDAKLRHFFEDLERNGVLKTSMVVFISDHGIRFGDIRYTHTGWYEERLPFVYFWLPEWFRRKHPTALKNIQANQNIFTTPYDVFMTLQDILAHSGVKHTVRPSSACSTCASLFEKAQDRNCEDAGIEFHWCTCENYIKVSSDTAFVLPAAKFAISEINKIATRTKLENKCSEFTLNHILGASVSRNRGKFSELNDYFLIQFRTYPDAVFEATVSIKEGDYVYDVEFELEGSISRLDSYSGTSDCVSEDKKYCYCKGTFR